MTLGKTIKIYLADGTVTGIRHAELMNWAGQAVACPRNRVGELAKWEESKRPGVYILFGYDDEAGQPMAYIGEAENVLDRLQSHVANKDFWNEVIFFTNKDENLTKAHVKFLESRFIRLANQAKRYKLEDGNVPQEPALPRGDRDSMEEFIGQARGLIGVLGHRILEPLAQKKIVENLPREEEQQIEETDKDTLSGTRLYLAIKNITAEAVLTDEGIVVLTGSIAAKEAMDSLSVGYRKLRESLIDQNVLSDKGEYFEFTKDQLFSNPSPAAAIVVGYSINGRRNWKDENGKTLAKLEGSTD